MCVTSSRHAPSFCSACLSSLSYAVAPVFYAHLAADHCRKYLDQDDGSDAGSVSDTGSRSQRLQSAPAQLRKLMAHMHNTMFFC